jgi:tRNA A37 threonylcarbamoyladenosine modification protein TsaB
VDWVLDTTDRKAYFGVRQGDSLKVFQWSGSNHTERLSERVAEVLATTGGQPPKRVVVITGPGSFTGIRIGLSFLLGFSFGDSAPFETYGLHKFDLLSLILRRQTPSSFPCQLWVQSGNLGVYVAEAEASGLKDSPRFLMGKDLPVRGEGFGWGEPLPQGVISLEEGHGQLFSFLDDGELDPFRCSVEACVPYYLKSADAKRGEILVQRLARERSS